ncbi:MAG TPA: hypothetical protein VMT03_24420 [Polyangia bacterium]|nr:hypothetical protein [Polyangia bacterium]
MDELSPHAFVMLREHKPGGAHRDERDRNREHSPPEAFDGRRFVEVAGPRLLLGWRHMAQRLPDLEAATGSLNLFAQSDLHALIGGGRHRRSQGILVESLQR